MTAAMVVEPRSQQPPDGIFTRHRAALDGRLVQSMSRHPRLRPLSRDHHGALVQARRLRQAADSDSPLELASAVQEFARAIPEILDHFEAEETYLLPLVENDELVQRLVTEHRQLRATMQQLAAVAAGENGEAHPDTARSFGEQLAAHVRWEESELFTWIEQHVSVAQIESLAEPMRALEQRRGRPDRINDD
ncbi:MAG: hemerythrin domain-containing protein [Planctomycetota bacterium]